MNLAPHNNTVTFREAFLLWLKIGFINFGGPAGQIALMHRLIVEERRWISETRFLHALNYCMLLPGPEAQQLAIYIGWLLHKTWGGIVAGLLFILPGFVLMTLIAAAYVLLGDLSWMQGLLFGLQAATLAIVLEAVQRLAKKALKHRALYLLAGMAFVAIFVFAVPFPLIVLSAGLIGLLGHRYAPQVFQTGGKAAAGNEPEEAVPTHAQPDRSWTLRVLLSGVLLWGLPVLLLFLTLGAQQVFTQEALFFSKMAVVTFGGAYAVLAYVAQQAVERYGWLLPGEMVQGLALAETTPGPLIMVLTYVGFLGAYRDPGALPPLSAGMLGALLSTWVTFVPCFLWIFLGAPYIERLRGNRQLAAALSGITAAVVGVVLNLSLWFAIHVLFKQVDSWSGYGMKLPLPALDSLQLPALLLAALAMLALLRLHLNLMLVLGGCAGLGLLLKLLGLA
ncbi:chromate transporter [Solimonas aquatica]|uniref:Chromate transporter n=1 Tax=Solimonas aquatica TaxID=489703 RepID=A0A1H9BNP9_9GAMM|nr:chromate efflux transporter [Solimonas aquatica]SEP90624.1 chromate transporter [Solimonas aquatica]